MNELSLATETLLKQLNDKLKDLSGTALPRSVNSTRWFHGRGQMEPALAFLCLDFYDPVLQLSLFNEPEDGEIWLENFVAALVLLIEKLPNNAGLKAINVQHRYLAGAPSKVMWGELPEHLYAQRNEQRFTLQLGHRQNTGFFLDMEPGRQWLEMNAAGCQVLNLFAYTCAFSVVALKAGAKQVVNVDMSSGALSQGRDNHRLNNLAKEQSVFMCENILKSWSRIRRRGPYNLAILDPPSFQKGSFVASKDYVRIVRRLPELMPEGGKVLACLNAPELDEAFLQALFVEELPHCRFVERLRPSEDFPDVDPARQLKLLVFELEA